MDKVTAALELARALDDMKAEASEDNANRVRAAVDALLASFDAEGKPDGAG